MNSLEEVYLANVVLYFTTIETAINFIYVNSKCRDALEILRMNPNFELIQQKDPFCILRNYEIFKKELQLFPNLETIQYSSESLRFHEYMKHLNCKIKLPTWYDKTYINHTTFFQYYKHNLVELSMNSNDLYIDQFPSLQRLTIIITPTRFNCRFHLTDCINTSIHKIKYLKIYIISSNFYSLQTMDFITEMKTLNIENSIVHFSSKKDYQRIIDIPNVFNYITLCSSYYFDGIDPRVVILSNLSHTFEIESQLNKNIIETYFNQYLPINVVIKSRNIYDLDLRSLTYIKHIDNQIGLKQITFPSSLTSLIDQNQPSNCPYLKELILNHCNQQQITSSTITKLTCKHCSFEHLNCSQLEHLSLFQTQFVNVIDCCNTLTYLGNSYINY
ncbi:Leucine-rich repeat containing protein [Entamoeba marina]